MIQITQSTSPMRRFPLAAGAVAAAALATLGAGPAIADVAEPEQLPVPYTFLSGAVKEITQPEAPLAGANDWNCRPPADHPEPVVLVHGTFGGGTDNWATLGPLLHNQGYCVYTLTYGNLRDASWPLSAVGGVQSIPDVSVPEVADFVDRVRESTGAEEVDLVGHSQGVIVAGDVAKRTRPRTVAKLVSIAGPWDGTFGDLLFGSLDGNSAQRVRDLLAGTPIASMPQMITGSEYLRGLEGVEGTPYAKGVEYTNISTRYDEAIVPYTSGQRPAPEEPGYAVTNHVIQDGCENDLSDHSSVPSSPRTADYVLSALDPAHRVETRCVSTIPLHGAIGPVPPVRARA
ncbi:esterase/lipase family protein [Dietzia sp.]|uniref:esterase/lipase family protein n=1 Tax=Dietzia sp. TaxID=1871616 RepID=UPI002FDAFA0D